MERRRQVAQEERARASMEDTRRRAEEHSQDLARMELNTMLSESLASTERAVAEDAWEEVASEQLMVASLEAGSMLDQTLVEEAEQRYNEEEATVRQLQLQLDELRAKRQKFEAMASKAAREAKELRNQISLEQAAVEVKQDMKSRILSTQLKPRIPTSLYKRCVLQSSKMTKMWLLRMTRC